MVDYSGARATPRMDLGVALMEYIDNQNEFIGTKVLPVFKSNLKTAAFSAITRETLTQNGDTKRSKRGNYNRGSFGAKDKTFECFEHGWEQPLGDDERNLYAKDFDAEMAATRAAEGVVLRAQEKRIADALFNTSTFTGSALYTDYSSAGPWATVTTDVRAQGAAVKAKIRANCGILPNSVIMNFANFERLKKNTDIKDSIKYVARATDAEIGNAIADYLGVKYLIVASQIYNSAKEGQTFVGADIWSSSYVMFASIVENAQDLSQPGLGRTFLWVADCPDNVFVESYRDETVRGDVFRVRQHTDEKIIDPYFAHLIKVA